MSSITRKTALAVAISVALGALPVFAEESEEKEEEQAEKLVVVGTRAAPRSVADSAVPIDIISDTEFARNGAVDMPSMIQSLVPSFNVNDQPINDAATLVRPANLRGLSSDHTLVLVNGKRRHRSAVITFLGGGLSDGAQGPDLSVIPVSAIQAVEVLRDGAAAQYGSDAIAGVLNYRLKDNSQGGSVELRTGSYYEGDGDSFQLSGDFGLPVTENGFASLSYEFKKSDPTVRSVQREDAAALIAAGNTAVADPAQIWGSPEFKSDYKFFLNSGIDISNGGNERDVYLFGNLAKREVEGGFYYRNPHTRGGVFDGGVIDPDPDVEGDEIQTLLVGDLTGDMSGNCPSIANDNYIAVGDNVLTNQRYIDEVLNNPNCFAFNELLPGGFTPRFGGTVTDQSLVTGISGEFDNEIYYDVSGSYGYNKVEFAIKNTINPSMGPETPMEFSPGQYEQTEKNFNLDLHKAIMFGEKEVSIAGGFEYRHETFEITAGDPASYEVGPLAAQGFGIGSNGFPGFKPADAGKFSRHNTAFYFDSEMNVTENWMVAGAIRFEDYSDFGSTTKGKLATRLQFNEQWAGRAAFSTGFRAPTVGQNNVRNVSTAFGPNGLEDQATLPPTNPISVQKGGKALGPEHSKSLSLGMIGELSGGVYLTVDYFRIKVTDRLSQTSALALSPEDIQALLDQGVSDASSFSSVKYFTNDFDTTTQGIDLVLNFSGEMFGGDNKHALVLNWTDTQVDSYNPDNINAAKVRMLEENLPSTRGSYSLNHTNGDWSVLGRVNYYGGFYEDHLDAGGEFNIESGSKFTVDTEVGYSLTSDFTVALGAKNLFDTRPDDNPHAVVVGSKYPTTTPIGINGGYYYLRAVYNF